MNIKNEDVQCLFLDIPKIAGERVFRVSVNGGRFYMRKGSSRLYRSLTTFLDSVMPQNKFLAKWREGIVEQLGSVQAADQFVQATADYGTCLHIMVADYVQNGQIDWMDASNIAGEYLLESGLKEDVQRAATSEIIDDFAAIAQFLHDYEVKVLAVEIPVFIEAGVATLIDLVVEMNEKNYDKTPPEKRNRIKAIINLKSGKKGFFDAHKMQLVGERKAWNETYGAILQIDEIYNLAPNDWRDKPTYKIERQTAWATDNDADALFDLYLELAKKRGTLEAPKRKLHSFSGVMEYGQNPSESLTTYEITEIHNLIEA